jgi:phosphoribosylanthranilate isomerase
VPQQNMVKIKICGITTVEDADKALNLGADMLGFNFYPASPRAITPDRARAIIEYLPASSFNIALFVNADKQEARQIIAAGRRPDGSAAFSGVQFHGDEDADYCRGWELKVIKAFRLREQASLADMNQFPADYCLLDSWSAGYGGSGEGFPWEWLGEIDTSRLILSGGLRADNVAEAIRRIHPFGVDVCSGVEARPGIKDHAKLKDFIQAAKNA